MDKVKKSGKTFEVRTVPLPDLSNEKVFAGGIKVKALFDPEVKWRLIEKFGPSCFEEQEDGRLLFHADYSDMENLVSWLLTFGDKAEVIEPLEVRTRLLDIAETMKKTYGRKKK